MPRLLLLGALLGTAVAPAALAQPNPDATPTAGTVALDAGFSPDPHAVDVTAGGPVAAAGAAGECVGYVSEAPSAVIAYGGGPLRLFVRSSADTVLLVRTPEGAWVCNDDEEGLNAGLTVDGAGRYAVWIGTFSEGGEAEATLYASATDGAPPPLDPDGAPSAGAVSLAAGFSPDPHEVGVTAGGSISAFVYEGCAGFIDPGTPSAVLDLDADGDGPLYVYAQTAADEDLTLIVMGPDGAVHCNDDASGLDPGLVVEPAAAGRYAVWVGTYSSRARTEAPARASLFFSEVEGPTSDFFYDEEGYDDGVYAGGEDISRFAAPAHGTLTLEAGYGTREVPVEAGGPDAVSVSGFGCVGYIDNGAPDLNVVYGGEGEALAFYTASGDDADLTMLVSLPDGTWRCSDDALGRDPAVVVEAPAGGLYNVWVGTYAQDRGASATLHVSETDPR